MAHYEFADPETQRRFLEESRRTFAELWGANLDAVNLGLFPDLAPDAPRAAYQRAVNDATTRLVEQWRPRLRGAQERAGAQIVSLVHAMRSALYLSRDHATGELPRDWVVRWRTLAQDAAKSLLEAEGGPDKRSHHADDEAPRTVPLPDDDIIGVPEPEETGDAAERVAALREALTPKQRALVDTWLELAEHGNPTWKEAGALLGMSENAAWVAVHRLAKRLA